jgi:hypothetical protein
LSVDILAGTEREVKDESPDSRTIRRANPHDAQALLALPELDVGTVPRDPFKPARTVAVRAAIDSPHPLRPFVILEKELGPTLHTPVPDEQVSLQLFRRDRDRFDPLPLVAVTTGTATTASLLCIPGKTMGIWTRQSGIIWIGRHATFLRSTSPSGEPGAR